MYFLLSSQYLTPLYPPFSLASLRHILIILTLSRHNPPISTTHTCPRTASPQRCTTWSIRTPQTPTHRHRHRHHHQARASNYPSTSTTTAHKCKNSARFLNPFRPRLRLEDTCEHHSYITENTAANAHPRTSYPVHAAQRVRSSDLAVILPSAYHAERLGSTTQSSRLACTTGSSRKFTSTRVPAR
jgi:hypothetical protein